MKKFISLVVILCLILTILPKIEISVQAADDEYEINVNVTTAGDLYNAICAELSGGKSVSDITSLIVTGEMNDTDFGDLELYLSNKITKIDISGVTNITAIPASVFNGYMGPYGNLKEIILPDQITSIGYHAFDGCSNLLTIELPTSLKTIGEGAFFKCSKLTLTELPDGVTSIGNGAFQECFELALTKLPDGITRIEQGTFWNCYKLSLTELPAGVVFIDVNAFEECTSMPSVLKCNFAVSDCTMDVESFLGSSVEYFLFEDEDGGSESFTWCGARGVNHTGDYDNDGMNNITEYNQGRLLYKPDIEVKLSYDDTQKKAVFEYNDDFARTLPSEDTEYTIKYIGRNSTNYAESTTPPIAVGDYTATYALTTAGELNFTLLAESTLTTNFEIRLVSGLSVSCADVVYGNTPTPVVLGSTGGTRTTEYKVKGADDSTYQANVPTNVGEYTVRVSEAATSTYKSASVTADFSITKKDITISGITAENKVYDGNNVATLDFDNVVFGGIVSGDTLSVIATGTFADENVGTDKVVNITDIVLSGSNIDNYRLSINGNQTTALANITRAEVVVSVKPVASDIINKGEPLSKSVIIGGTTSVAGTWNWTNKDEIITVSGEYEMTFTPEDLVHYAPVTIKVNVTVLEDSETKDTQPTTGDTSTTMIWMLTLIIAGMTVGVMGGRKRHNGKIYYV